MTVYWWCLFVLFNCVNFLHCIYNYEQDVNNMSVVVTVCGSVGMFVV